jgi:aminocarboxymuconate-semialdehyde decarboxylase
MTKLDIFCHILPRAFYERMLQVARGGQDMQRRVREIPILIDLDLRFRVMDGFQPYQQVFSLASPALEALGGPDVTIELARIANDGMADIVERHRDRFPAFVASLPMADPDAAVREIDRAVLELGAVGVQIFTNVDGLPLDDPRFEPVIRRMAELDRPIWLHPWRMSDFADYATESRSRFELWWVFGWPYETSVAMARLVFAGYFDRFPDLKIITHHMGAMVPYFAGRVGPGLDLLGVRSQEQGVGEKPPLRKRPFDYFKMFYADTAVFGALPAMKCGLEFFGVDRVLFSSDMPFDPEKGPGYIRETIRNIEDLPISAEERRAIYEGNARRLLRL